MTSELTIHSSRILAPSGVVNGAIRIVDGKVAAVQEGRSAAGSGVREYGPGSWVIPGLIDTHIHGAVGQNFMSGSPEAIAAICRYHAAHGTTGLLATTGAASDEATEKAIRGLVPTVRQQPSDGAAVLGIHLEGPFLNEIRRGAQDPEAIQAPDMAKLERWLEMGRGTVLMMTIAPELPGALELVRAMTARGVRAVAGHTDATYAQMAEAMAAGICHTIHTFNGMRGLHHREPGAAGAALELDGLTAEVIPDGFHVHPAVIRLLYRMKGTTGMTLVTDAVDAAGLPDGEYQSERSAVRVVNGRVELADGSSLAGSTLTMIGAVRNVMQFCGIGLAEAVTMASLGPARLLGLAERKGTIEEGKDADLVVLDEHLQVQATIAGGKIIYSKN